MKALLFITLTAAAVGANFHSWFLFSAVALAMLFVEDAIAKLSRRFIHLLSLILAELRRLNR